MKWANDAAKMIENVTLFYNYVKFTSVKTCSVILILKGNTRDSMK